MGFDEDLAGVLRSSSDAHTLSSSDISNFLVIGFDD